MIVFTERRTINDDDGSFLYHVQGRLAGYNKSFGTDFRCTNRNIIIRRQMYDRLSIIGL